MRHDYPQEFEDLWAIYPKRLGGNPKVNAYKAWKTRVAQGYAHTDILQGLERYKAFCDKTGKTGSEFVLQAATFFGPAEWWLEDWSLPDEKPEWTRLPFGDEDLWPFAKRHGFSNPGSMNFRQYRQKLQAEIEDRLARV